MAAIQRMINHHKQVLSMSRHSALLNLVPSSLIFSAMARNTFSLIKCWLSSFDSFTNSSQLMNPSPSQSMRSKYASMNMLSLGSFNVLSKRPSISPKHALSLVTSQLSSSLFLMACMGNLFFWHSGRTSKARWSSLKQCKCYSISMVASPQQRCLQWKCKERTQAQFMQQLFTVKNKVYFKLIILTQLTEILSFLPEISEKEKIVFLY